MPLASPSTSSHLAFPSKMEDRKRSAAQDELAPPTKRQAVNGGRSRDVDADMPWARDLEVCGQRTTTSTICVLDPPGPYFLILDLSCA